MGVYLGSKRVGVTIKGGTPDVLKSATGKVFSDEDGVITFPAIDFEPFLITIWNISEIDWMRENGEEDWSGDYVRYTHDGTMLMAIKQDGSWVSQGLGSSSGTMFITNTTAEGGTMEFYPQASSSGITEHGNGVYSFRLTRLPGEPAGEEDNPWHDITNTEFNYAIYG